MLTSKVVETHNGPQSVQIYTFLTHSKPNIILTRYEVSLVFHLIIISNLISKMTKSFYFTDGSTGQDTINTCGQSSNEKLQDSND